MLRTSKSTQPLDGEVEISLSSDGGLTKKILKEGTGATVPQGALVAVHYVGRLPNGSIFDDSYGRQQPFCFYVGHQKVIKGWDIGLKSMKVGEVALLKCSPHYAYGSRETGPIPANSTLFFEIELLEVKEDSEKYSYVLIFSVILVTITVGIYFLFNRLYPLNSVEQ
jgi:FK506-binding protein 4/5